jgi:hypothetical protein
MLSPPKDGMPEYVISAGLPRDPLSEVVSIEYQWQTNSIVLTLSHPSFAAVPTGADPPWLSITARRWG